MSGACEDELEGEFPLGSWAAMAEMAVSRDEFRGRGFGFVLPVGAATTGPFMARLDGPGAAVDFLEVSGSEKLRLSFDTLGNLGLSISCSGLEGFDESE